MINQYENRNRNRFNIQTLINTHYTSIVRLEIELDICIIMYYHVHKDTQCLTYRKYLKSKH
jgi:hypothetical protein